MQNTQQITFHFDSFSQLPLIKVEESPKNLKVDDKSKYDGDDVNEYL